MDIHGGPKKPRCELLLKLAVMRLESDGKQSSIESLNALDALARIDPEEVENMLGMSKQDNKSDGHGLAIIGFFLAVMLVVIGLQMNEISSLKSQIERLEEGIC